MPEDEPIEEEEEEEEDTFQLTDDQTADFRDAFKKSDGTYDVSNADRTGYSEVELLQFVCNGVGLLIEMEKLAADGKSFDALIPAAMVK